MMKLKPKTKESLYKRVVGRLKHLCSFGAALLTVVGVTEKSEASSDSVQTYTFDSTFKMDTTFIFMGDICHEPITLEERLSEEREEMAIRKAKRFISNIFNVDKESVKRNCKSTSKEDEGQ